MKPNVDYITCSASIGPAEVEWALVKTGQILAIVILLLLSLAFLLLFDRKVWAAVQLRKGPNVVGPFGLLQSFADFFKFVFKEIVIPAGANKTVFILAPLLTFVLAFVGWAVVPWGPGVVIADLNVGILYLFAISSLGVYGIIMGGWASNSKYPFLGGLRSAAQMVSYEVSIGFIIITVLLLVGFVEPHHHRQQPGARASGRGTRSASSTSRNSRTTSSSASSCSSMFVMFFVSALAETNRPPFDLPEAESELVAGYQVEYSSTPYLLFMIGEYLNIVLMCAMIYDPVPRRLALPVWTDRALRFVAVLDRRAGHADLLREDLVVLLPVRDGEGDRAALPLRPADAPRLEDLPADVARGGRRHWLLRHLLGAGRPQPPSLEG